jgi:phosphotransferase system  glucose/maltose/N-acetylglucosamine-specific IIC component
MAVKEAVATVKETTASLLDLGPWVILALGSAGLAGWMVYKKQRQKKAAQSAVQEMVQ